ncbi:MAG: cupin domain-containing protein [Cyclobacteriaceae bacterium]
MEYIVKGSVSQAADLVAYSENSIVSKQIIKSKSGNITAFAFDKGQGLSEHTAPFDAWLHILAGKAEIMIGSEFFEMVAGDAILLPANVPHAVKATNAFKMLLTMIREPKND